MIVDQHWFVQWQWSLISSLRGTEITCSLTKVKAPKCGGNWCHKVVEKKEPDKDYPYDSKWALSRLDRNSWDGDESIVYTKIQRSGYVFVGVDSRNSLLQYWKCALWTQWPYSTCAMNLQRKKCIHNKVFQARIASKMMFTGDKWPIINPLRKKSMISVYESIILKGRMGVCKSQNLITKSVKNKVV